MYVNMLTLLYVYVLMHIRIHVYMHISIYTHSLIRYLTTTNGGILIQNNSIITIIRKKM
jgi:hypothetical protein